MRRGMWMPMLLVVAATGAELLLAGCPSEDGPGATEEGDGGVACGSEALYSGEHEGCGAMEAEGDGACFCMLGYAWDGEACLAVNGCECLGEDCTSLAQTEDECLALHEACEEEDLGCGSPALYAIEHESCGAMVAEGDGECFCMLGFGWDGSGCVAITGCACEGRDCNALSETEETCLEQHASCDGGAELECGSPELNAREHDACEAMEATGDGLCNCMLGFIWDGSGCEAITGCECVGADCDALAVTAEECLAGHAECHGAETFECGSAFLFSVDHDRCEAMDAEGDNACFCFLGFVWNGSGCEGIAGCECAGVDCNALAETEEACLAAHEGCAG